MKKCICPECSQPVYSSSFREDWVCPYCNSKISIKKCKPTENITEED